jgi:thioredoxin:protein disulfide reductase
VKSNLYSFLFSLFSTSIFFTTTRSSELVLQQLPLKDSVIPFTIHIDLDPDEYIYKESLDLSIDNPYISVNRFYILEEPKQLYNQQLKESKSIFTSKITLQGELVQQQETKQETALHIRYISNTQGPQDKILAVQLPMFQQKEEPIAAEPQTDGTGVCQKNCVYKNNTVNWRNSFSISEYISQITKRTESLWIKFILVFLLGILASLTPCIYPMIPITIGILQTQASTSLWKNIAVSLAYTCGIATTFALFGLLASCTGPIYGHLLSNPFFVSIVVLMLAYLGFSMLGLYELYMPNFFNSSSQKRANGSLASSFLFGAASGTIASPCVSPALMLLLSIVATLSNPFLGFSLLFIFGFGLSTPLLIVATFSSSLSLMPRAGMWMVEIKRIFGILLLGMCLYYIHNIITWHLFLLLSAISSLVSGLFYLWICQKTRSPFWKKLNTIVGVILIIVAMILFSNAYQEQLYSETMNHSSLWQHDYEAAQHYAQSNNLPLLLDFWASFCSLCKQIDKTIFTDEELQAFLQMHTVPVKIDGSRPTDEPYATLRKRYNVQGLPLYLLVNPHTHEIIKSWDSGLYCKNAKEFLEEIRSDCAVIKLTI